MPRVGVAKYRPDAQGADHDEKVEDGVGWAGGGLLDHRDQGADGEAYLEGAQAESDNGEGCEEGWRG